MEYLLNYKIFESIKTEVPHIESFKTVLDKSNNVSISQRKYFNAVITSVKKAGNMASPRQLDILKRIRTGDFNYHPKN